MKFLTIEDVVKMNVIQIKTFSPKELIGLKDPNALDMALNQINVTVFGEEVYSSIYEKTTILMIQIIKKHPFHNANKRTALLSALVFLRINGYDLKLQQQAAIELVVHIATFTEDFSVLKRNVAKKIESNTAQLYALPNFFL